MDKSLPTPYHHKQCCQKILKCSYVDSLYLCKTSGAYDQKRDCGRQRICILLNFTKEHQTVLQNDCTKSHSLSCEGLSFLKYSYLTSDQNYQTSPFFVNFILIMWYLTASSAVLISTRFMSLVHGLLFR